MCIRDTKPDRAVKEMRQVIGVERPPIELDLDTGLPGEKGPWCRAKAGPTAILPLIQPDVVMITAG
jgi:hypothetical protein